MIEPSLVYDAAIEKESENAEFLAYLKRHAAPAELDSQFIRLYDELFSGYDCCKCNNCCRIYAIALRADEADAIAAYLGLSLSDFTEKYHIEPASGCYRLDGPCPFLCADGKCLIHACKPTVCRNYPYLNRPDSMGRLINVISFTKECPVVFELVERLKDIYSFRA